MLSASLHPGGVHAPLGPRLVLTGLVAVAEAAHLTWEHLHGGIARHHLLNDPTLPALWNGWGLLLLPLLAWFASRRLLRRTGPGWHIDPGAKLHLLGALAAGAALSIAFSTGQERAAGLIFLAIGLSAFVVRAYRGEYLLGFVLGMTFTFGALLPTLIGGIVALVSVIAWRGAYPVLRRAGAALRA